MSQMKKWENTIKQIAPWLLIVGIMYLMTLLRLPLVIVNLFLTLSTAARMYILWKNDSNHKWEIIIIVFGFAIRVLVCLIDIYGSGYVTIPFSGDDSLNFYNTSVEYYYGDTSRIYTNYPYILNAIYQIAGLNRFAAQYVNILCWCFCVLILQKSCKLFDIETKFRLAAVFLYSFMPFNICISSILMRDMIVALSITLTSYCLLKWMWDGKYVNILVGVVATVPVLLVHNCVLAMLGVMGLVVAFYSPAKKKFCIEKKCIFIMMTVFVTALVLLLNQRLRFALFTQIPIFSGNILDIINQKLDFFYTHTGGTTYLEGKYVSNYAELFVGTFERIAYFLCSPVPFLWRGFSDVFAFIVSSSVYIIGIFAMAVSMFYKRRDSYRAMLFLVIFFVSGIFAWGVSNGGTAMRHREKLSGIIILLIVYSVQLIVNKRRGANE